jgi:predicted AAA+ superfamily ATPase
MDQPNTWIYRVFQGLFDAPDRIGPFSAILLLGPRQVGKSSLLLRCCSSDTKFINLDDIETRTRANSDPVLFSRELKIPLLIDEIQYAPKLLSTVKILADKSRPPPKIWITGSQSFEVMKGVKESLAGRIAIFNLFGLSLAEKSIDLNSVPEDLFEEFFIGTFPALRQSDTEIWSRFMSSYVQTYIQRDIAELLGIQKRREFEIFLKICALRTGQLVNYNEIAKDAGVSPSTAKEWISILEDSYLIRLVHPYYTNRTKRLVKTPKLYFVDSGLCAYLAGWKNSEQIRLGPWAGAFFETVIFGELLRWFSHRGKDFNIYFWRTRDGEEVDFILETAKGIVPIEVKLGSPVQKEILPHHKLCIDNIQEGAIISIAMSQSIGELLAENWRCQDLSFNWLE